MKLLLKNRGKQPHVHTPDGSRMSRDSKAGVAWRSIVARYHKSDPRRALWQVVNTYVPYAALWYLMYRSLEVSYWITLGLAVVAAGFLARIFIVFHDCGHGSFFGSRVRNDVLGFISGVLTFTPYQYWRHAHSIHHATAGNLDRRGVGDIWTMTVAEYRRASLWLRLRYRFYRNPFVLFLLGPVCVFVVKQRVAAFKAGWRWQQSVQWTNLVILIVAVALSALIGIKAYLLIQLPIISVAAIVGAWLFYVQHQFDGVYWERRANWDYYTTAMRGSSFYKLPKILQWFSGNIGFHHIHHLSPRIPNYFLEKCHDENPLFQQATVLCLRESLRTMRYRLWDEEQQKLVGAGAAWL
jgi:omega-6 fatty acid desaturase (delta-12 desaturase)